MNTLDKQTAVNSSSSSALQLTKLKNFINLWNSNPIIEKIKSKFLMSFPTENEKTAFLLDFYSYMAEETTLPPNVFYKSITISSYFVRHMNKHTSNTLNGIPWTKDNENAMIALLNVSTFFIHDLINIFDYTNVIENNMETIIYSINKGLGNSFFISCRWITWASWIYEKYKSVLSSDFPRKIKGNLWYNKYKNKESRMFDQRNATALGYYLSLYPMELEVVLPYFRMRRQLTQIIDWIQKHHWLPYCNEELKLEWTTNSIRTSYFQMYKNYQNNEMTYYSLYDLFKNEIAVSKEIAEWERIREKNEKKVFWIR